MRKRSIFAWMKCGLTNGRVVYGFMRPYIVQERTAGNYASTSNTRSDESRGKEITTDDSTSTTEKPPIESEVQEV